MLSGNDTKFISKWLKEELMALYNNIVAQLVQSRSCMTRHLSKKKNLILRFDFNCTRVIIWTY